MDARKVSRIGPAAAALAAAILGMCGAAPSAAAEAPGAGKASPADQARQILQDTGVKGGLVVHLGCGDGRLTAALRAADAYTVHGLDADAANVEKARAHVRSLGLYGPVALEQFDGDRLPYADNLVNLVVTEDGGKVAAAEIMRVVAPGGAACIGKGGRWEKTVKPRQKDIDEWTHFLHDAGNNAVARDAQVGLPRSLHWVAPPLWLRSHETPSGVQAAVTGGGRLFYIFDEGLIGITDQRLPERWSLICRDAFNGKLLWTRPLEKWGWPEWAAAKFAGADWTTITGGRTTVPDQNQRRLVADGERLYATLSFDAPLAILDAATGRTLATVAQTAPAREIVAAEGIAVVFSGPAAAAGGPAAKPAGKRAARAAAEGAAAPAAEGAARAAAQGAGRADGALTAVNGQTGAVIWRADTDAITPLALAIDAGRVIYLAGGRLAALDLKTGRNLWETQPQEKGIRTLVAHQGTVLLLTPTAIEARDAASGGPLWHKQVPARSGFENQDLFVIDGVVWPGLVTAGKDLQPAGKSADVLALGLDLRTGQEKKRIVVQDLRSPEHHHRCYRNKATERFIISSLEGTEFLDLKGDSHSQNNFLRGACKYGMMPANGLLYVPADQCFCQPGAKLLGFTAVAAEPAPPVAPVPDGRRLEKGPAYGAVPDAGAAPAADDWPTYRRDPARHGSSPAAVARQPAPAWRARLGGALTAPVAAGGRVYVAARDAHTVYALDAASGNVAWTFTAGGRIDSPPTVHRGRILFGSADGRVYCLRASDGALAWRFLAAPADRRIAAFDQVESAWPVHGSVLVENNVAYVTAGRSTYLDGGIRLYGLDPASGRILHRATLSGPLPDRRNWREVSFYIPGANSDVLVSEGGALYMRQKRLTPALEEVKPEVLSSKGEADVGLHVFSTAGLLDASWYNRTFWMYAKRWPGFQLANQAPKAGQLLVVDEAATYGVKVFYRRNVHSTMFFPAKEGYLLFADKNSTEPQIVGEPGARTPLAWLPQSEFGRTEGPRKLDSPAFGLDKMIGYTRADPPLWTRWLPVRIRALVKAGDALYASGPADVLDPKDIYAAFEGRKGARLVAVSATDGAVLSERELDSPPVFDGLIAAGARLFVSLEDGTLLCLK
ncbi:MAG: methyltransferase domain-containing protein [Planctomycetes bacterium]|nr:methyltransferase domain-containing protein [Planctomycetota bacterium]